MNVLSLFDGMSCGQIALNRLGIKVDNYYASEIDKHAITVTQANFPNTIQLGDVSKFEDWDIDWCKIDLVIGGSPCQGFSFAGKQLNFEDPRSKLFFKYLEVCEKVGFANPNMKFLLENVRMKKEYQDVITKYMGVDPVMINSSLVSAQNRVRLYWTNIEGITIPEDKNILLKDIIQENVEFNMINNYNKKIEGKNNNKSITSKKYFSNKRVFDSTIKNINDIEGICLLDSYNKKLYKDKSPTLTTRTDASNSTHLIIKEATKIGYVEIKPHEGVDLTFIMSKTRRGRRMESKSNCLTATNYEYCWYNGTVLRKLTPIECERLQTVPDNYTNYVSNSHRYKMLGNGWTVDVVAHIFKNIK